MAGAFTPALGAQEVPPIFQDSIPEASQVWRGERVSMSLKDADLAETLRSFARLGGFNLLLQPGIKGTVTVELKDVPWDQALASILRINGLGMDLLHGTMRVAPVAELERMTLEDAGSPSLADAIQPELKVEGRLETLDAVLVARLLTKVFLTEDGRAWANPATNTLTVIDRAPRLRRQAKLVALLEKEKIRGEDFQALARRARIHWPATQAGSR
ncbi:MAG: hypothetical protein AAF725_01570 [Acidobacteriota bacterium]